MQKSLVLIATLAVASTQAYMTGNARQRLQNDFTIHSLEVEEVRSKHGMRPLQYHSWKEDFAQKKKLQSGHNVQQCSVNDIDIFAESFECARGFAYGLQFSPLK